MRFYCNLKCIVEVVFILQYITQDMAVKQKFIYHKTEIRPWH